MTCDQHPDGACVLSLPACPRIGALCVRAAGGSAEHIAMIRELAGSALADCHQAEPPPSPRLAIERCPDRLHVEPG